MARISEREIEELKAQISVERLAESAGVELKRVGQDLHGRCPFHDDRSPSLVITPERNIWHCLGACQAGGSVIDWVMRAEGVSFRHAVTLLRERYAPSLVADAAKQGRQEGQVPKKTTRAKLPLLGSGGAEGRELMEKVVSHYTETLKKSEEGLGYLKKRGLDHPELIEHFRLGYADRTLGYKLPQKNRKEGAELRKALSDMGILRESGHEHFNGSLVIPVFGAESEVVEMYGRKTGERLRAGTPNHLYLPGPHAGVFNAAALIGVSEVILCESLIDALTFWCAGFRNVTASYGVEGFTAGHLEVLKSSGAKKVLIAYDRDEAGDGAAHKLASMLIAEGLEAWRVRFPRNMDANEYAQKVQPAEQSLAAALRSAEWLGQPQKEERQGQRPGRGATKGREKASPAEPPSVSPPMATTSAAEPAKPDSSSRAEEAASSEKGAHISSLVAETERVSSAASSVAPPQVPAERASGEKRSAPLETSADGDQVTLTFGDRAWRIRGLNKNKTPGILKLNILLRRERFGFHVDTLELYSARHRAAFLAQAAQETSSEERVLKRDLGQVLLKLEQLQEAREGQPESDREKPKELTEQEKNEALRLLRDPKLTERILADFERLGVVGERTNKLTAYLAATSRKLDRPLAIVVQSSSAAGKSSLMEAVLKMVPSEERVSYSAMTGQSLFYMGEMELAHKVLSIAEEEGAERAVYALKLLQSEGELTIASTGKDPVTGRLVTQEYRVQGPVMIFLTTTALTVDEELLNRCIVLSVDETAAQTRAIHEQQRHSRTLEGQLKTAERGSLMQLHQNAQRLLRPLLVANPFAEELEFTSHQTRSRRDHMKYLTLIEAVTLLYQYQRPEKEVEHQGARVRYIEVTRADIALADELAAELLSRNLGELPTQTRRLLGLLSQYVSRESQRLGLSREDFRFTRREVREVLGWGDTQLKVHLSRLVELEYVRAARGRQTQSFSYELLCFAEDDSEETDDATTSSGRGQQPAWSGGGRPLVGVQAEVSRGDQTTPLPQERGGKRQMHAPQSSASHPGKKNGVIVAGPSSSILTATLPSNAALGAVAAGGE